MSAASLDAVMGYVRWEAGSTMTLCVSGVRLAEPAIQVIRRTSPTQLFVVLPVDHRLLNPCRLSKIAKPVALQDSRPDQAKRRSSKSDSCLVLQMPERRRFAPRSGLLIFNGSLQGKRLSAAIDS